MGVSEVGICIDAFIGLGIGIANIIMSHVGTGCDTTDAMGLNLSAYLLGQGICEIVLILYLIAFIVSFATKDSKVNIGAVEKLF
jgi:F0F1-type ATP synthase membrane subunit c/vacuolar-type H+-ATPase subunit K